VPGEETVAAAPVRSGGLAEAEKFWWRERPTAASLRRQGWLWSAWTAAIVVCFAAPGIFLLWMEPLTAPVALGCFAHAWVICGLYARRGARSVVPIGSPRSAARATAGDAGAERVALGLLGDLLGHSERALVARTGLTLQRGELGAWLLGEKGAILVRPGGSRVDCWCVRVGEADDLPAGDRVAHLLLALREDEQGFATVANLDFSGAAWRVRRRMAPRERPALDAARAAVREG
jgi:hypothetical protein